MPVKHDEIRHRILKILYIMAQENPESLGLDKETINKILDVPEKTIFFNMQYLAEKGLISLFKGIGTWFHARITAFGIDVVEDKEKYGEQFPFIQTTIQEIHARDIYGSVVQAVESQVTFAQQVGSVFQQARGITEAKDIAPTLRMQIEERLNQLEEELKKTEPDAGKIQELWKWLKRNANWVVPILVSAVLEGLKMALGR